MMSSVMPAASAWRQNSGGADTYHMPSEHSRPTAPAWDQLPMRVGRLPIQSEPLDRNNVPKALRFASAASRFAASTPAAFAPAVS